MKEFQIQFAEKTCKSFTYFVADEKTMYDVACKKANEELSKQLNRVNLPFRSLYKPIKILTVVEYDPLIKNTKRGGIKFKLQLMKTVFKFHGEHSETDYSYRLWLK